MSDIKLLPCPFCGGEARLDTEMSRRCLIIRIKCKSCHAKIAGYCADIGDEEKALTNIDDCTEKAVKCWNTRKPMERIVERLEEI